MQREFVAYRDSGAQLRTAMEAKDKLTHWKNWLDQMGRPSDLIRKFKLAPDMSDSVFLPPLSFVLQIPFRLQKPYISRDEHDFYFLDNPLRRDKVFQAPFVAATSWKGALRAALWHAGYAEDHDAIRRLFGSLRDNGEGQAGRLSFYPTFFDKIDLEVINPHNRKTGVGARGPILMECVPQKTPGDLFLLYVPFGPTTQPETEKRSDVGQDLEVLTQGLHAMLTIYGFGAKTSSGFGTVGDVLAGSGVLSIRAALADMTTSTETTPAAPSELARYLESPTLLHADFRSSDGGLKSEEEYEKSRGARYGKKDKQLYEKAKKWWEREGSQLAKIDEKAPPAPPPPSATAPPTTELSFARLSELHEIAQQVAVHLRAGGQE